MADNKSSDNIRTEHEQRMTEKPDAIGDDEITDQELLKTLLNFSIPRADTDDIANRLLEEFSSLNNLFGIDNDYLMSVDGVGLRTANLIKLCYIIMRRCEMQRINPNENMKNFKNVDDVRVFLASHFALLKEERLGILFLDASYRMIDFRFVASGDANSVKVDKVRLLLISRILGASYVYLAHNHPFGPAEPSLEDLGFTLSIKSELAEESIYLIDHFVIAEDKCVSILENKNMFF